MSRVEPLQYVWIGAMRQNGMEWNEVVPNEIQLFGFVNNEWNGMEHDGIHYIKFSICFVPNNEVGSILLNISQIICFKFSIFLRYI